MTEIQLDSNMSQAYRFSNMEKSESLIRTTVRLPQALLKDAKRKAIEDDLSLQDLLIRALQATVQSSKPRSQTAAYAADTPRKKQLAESEYQKMVRLLAAVGSARHLNKLERGKILAAIPSTEISEWIKQSEAVAKELSEFTEWLRSVEGTK